jgi:plastocyanin
MAVPLLLVALLAGCGGPTDSGGVVPEVRDGMYIIHLSSGNMFNPAHAKVPVNATVMWVNDGGVHDVQDADHNPPAWSSDEQFPGKLQPGDSYMHTYATAGTYHYDCSIHQSTGMKGTLTVG